MPDGNPTPSSLGLRDVLDEVQDLIHRADYCEALCLLAQARDLAREQRIQGPD
ncbi:MAG: hypothetical protein ABW034_24505 [Steroidobacteraceae bacterium]